MRSKRIAALAVALGAAVTPFAAEAATKPNKTGKARLVSSITVAKDKQSATLKVRYYCKSSTALWVSAKQATGRVKSKYLTREGSSEESVAWWQSHRNPFTCDGKKHTSRFTVDLVEPGSKGTLKKGVAYVQFCLTKGDFLEVSKSGWVKVKQAK